MYFSPKAQYDIITTKLKRIKLKGDSKISQIFSKLNCEGQSVIYSHWLFQSGVLEQAIEEAQGIYNGLNEGSSEQDALKAILKCFEYLKKLETFYRFGNQNRLIESPLAVLQELADYFETAGISDDDVHSSKHIREAITIYSEIIREDPEAVLGLWDVNLIYHFRENMRDVVMSADDVQHFILMYKLGGVFRFIRDQYGKVQYLYLLPNRLLGQVQE